ncbi:MAG TPA: hypothetical protein DF480_03755 [Clostridiales bacterium]|nr:hypothetical protein [Clostridiales bacterium]
MCTVSSTTTLRLREITAPVARIMASEVSGAAMDFRSMAPSIRIMSTPKPSISSQSFLCSLMLPGPAICT